ncbi:unnamed protein product [Urochloa humidicola]
MEDEEVNMSAEEVAYQHAAGGLSTDEFNLRGSPPPASIAARGWCCAVGGPCDATLWELLARYSLREQGLFSRRPAALTPPLPPQPHAAWGACLDARRLHRPCQQRPSSLDLTEVPRVEGCGLGTTRRPWVPAALPSRGQIRG